jgi:hypothetical protein
MDGKSTRRKLPTVSRALSKSSGARVCMGLQTAAEGERNTLKLDRHSANRALSFGTGRESRTTMQDLKIKHVGPCGCPRESCQLYEVEGGGQFALLGSIPLTSPVEA